MQSLLRRVSPLLYQIFKIYSYFIQKREYIVIILTISVKNPFQKN